MAFNPALPANNSPQSSAEMRAQFTGLKDLIDAVPGSAEFDAAVAAKVNNLMSTISPLSLTVSDPPTQAEVQAIADKLDQLIQALGTAS